MMRLLGWFSAEAALASWKNRCLRVRSATSGQNLNRDLPTEGHKDLKFSP